MLDQCFARFYKDWDSLRAQANELIRDVWSDPDAFKAVKWVTETLVTPELSAGPAWARSYKKPLGYPGDYVIMNYFYDQAWEGDTLFAKLVHRLLTTDPLPACVIPRMEMLRDAIARTLEERKTRAQPVRIASLGSGPAREVEEYLKRWQAPQPLHVILIDQDERALSYAYNRLYPLAARSAAPVKVQCLYVSFSQLVRNADVLRSLPQLDLVYAAGLVDYLRPITAKTIIRTLYAQLRSGGRLVAGNMKARPDVGWTNEFALDWPLILRTEDEMTDLAHGLEAAEVDVRLERTGYTYLLFVTKT
jgi:SAM-dependent methyltransferase